MSGHSNCGPRAACGTLIGLLACAPAVSHHGFTNHFDPDQEREIEGVVTRFEFVNPHVSIHLEVLNEDDTKESWVAETGGSSGFLRNGRLTRQSIKPGDHLLIVGHPARAKEFEMRANRIVLPNGTELRMNNPFVPIPFLQNNAAEQ